MNSTDPADYRATKFDQLTPEVMLAVNRCCDRFEQSWSESPPASLTEYLNLLEPQLATVALPELVTIDIEFRTRHQLPLDLHKYQQVAPGLPPGWLDEQIAKARGNRQTSSNEPSLTGTSLGDYDVQELLGAGGMGKVYKGIHRRMGRVVALKIMSQTISHLTSAKLRFEREVRAAASLQHPNIVTAFDAREDNGLLYLVSEFVDGTDLSRLVREQGKLSPKTALLYILQAAQGLRYAHNQGLIHRDIKPSNLLVDKRGVVKLLDLGLARFHFDDAQRDELTNSNQILGTAQYMAPEQARSPLQADPRSDIYSLGCTLYFLLTGQAPYPGTSQIDTLLSHVNAPIPRVRNNESGHDIPIELDDAIVRMMAKNPAQRPSDVRAVIKLLKPIFQELEKSEGSSKTNAKSALQTPQLFADLDLPAMVQPNQFEIKSGMPASKGQNHPLYSPAHIAWENSKRKSAVRSGDWAWLRSQPWWAAFLAAAGILLVVSMLIFWAVRTSAQGARVNRGSGFESRDPSHPNGEIAEKDSSAKQVTPYSNDPPQPSNGGGLTFDGIQSFVEVENFDLPVDGSVQIEVAVNPSAQRGPANLVSWAGAKTFTLYRDSEQHWGVAYFDGNVSRLRSSVRQLDLRRPVVLSGSWDGSQLHLFVDGSEIETEQTNYSLFPAPDNCLFLGGIPTGILPPSQGTRWFSGQLLAVRVSQGNIPTAARNIEELSRTNESTVALFRFREKGGELTRDESQRGWTGRLHNARW